MAQQRLIPKLGGKVDLKDYDPEYTGDYNKTRARKEETELEERLLVLQEKLYAQNTQALLVVLQAMDAGGKDGAVKKVFNQVNPQGIYVTSFKAPSMEELGHDFLWRVHHNVPRKGYIGIFNRSHYEDVLVVRVNQLMPPHVWEKNYDHINDFERLVTDSGTRILKFYLHISKDEQKQRLQERIDDPEKWWKFNVDDLKTRERWDEYMEAYEAMFQRCNTDYAPWHIVPANKKWYRDLVITRTIVETLEAMKVDYPKPAQDLSGIKIPD
jgi:PPK2 family polyphosphate:nucleotide phosphotransferase